MTDAGTTINYKQRLQYELIDIDRDLERFVEIHPSAEAIVFRIRDILGRCSHIIDGTDALEFCNDGGLAA